MVDPVLFATMLKLQRIAQGLSMNELAKRAGCDAAYISRMERPHREQRYSFPSRSLVLALATALGMGDQKRDQFLWTAGHAPVVDWQERALVAEDKLSRIRATLAW